MSQMSHIRRAQFQSETESAEVAVENAMPPEKARIRDAILKTLLYSDLFDYPLTLEEIAHYLINAQGSQTQVLDVLNDPAALDMPIRRVEGFYILTGRESTVARRRHRSEVSHRSWRKARFYARVLGHLPFVRMVAITGALAMDNSNKKDDVDILLVAAHRRVWLTRALAVLLVYAGKLTPNSLCPNYVISEEALALEPRTIYVAHEFVQMVPIYGHDIYRKMRAANPWVEQMLPNAAAPLHREAEYRPGKVGRWLKRCMEWLLSGKLGEGIDTWEMNRKIRKFAPRTARAHGNVIFDRDQVKGHFDDHGTRISSEYLRRLDELGL